MNDLIIKVRFEIKSLQVMICDSFLVEVKN